jgi:alpha-D-ribose 1-methylphosphonate 5-phosphate C-P lyase
MNAPNEVSQNLATYNFAYLDEQTKRMIRRAILKGIAMPGLPGAVRLREMPMPYGWGTGGVQVTASIIGPDDVLKVIDQGADDTTNAVSIRAFFAKTAVWNDDVDTRSLDHPDPPPHSGNAADRRSGAGLPGADPRTLAFPRAARDRDPQDACARGIRPHACEALRGHRPQRPYRHHLCLSGQGRGALRDGPVADAEIRQSEDAHVEALQLFGAGREKRIYAMPPHTDVVSLDFEDHPFEIQHFEQPCALCGAGRLSRRGGPRRQGRADVRLFRHRSLRKPAPKAIAAISPATHPEGGRGDGNDTTNRLPLPAFRRVSRRSVEILRQPDRLPDVSFDLWPGEVLADRRRIRFRQDHAAQLHFDAADADLRHGRLPDARWCKRATLQDGRGRAAFT